MVLEMIFCRSTVEMVIVDPEDLDFAETRVISWILLELTTVAAKMETTDLLR